MRFIQFIMRAMIRIAYRETVILYHGDSRNHWVTQARIVGSIRITKGDGYDPKIFLFSDGSTSSWRFKTWKPVIEEKLQYVPRPISAVSTEEAK